MRLLPLHLFKKHLLCTLTWTLFRLALLFFCSALFTVDVASQRLCSASGLLTRPFVLHSLSLAHNTIDRACLPFFTRVDTHYDTPRDLLLNHPPSRTLLADLPTSRIFFLRFPQTDQS